MHSLVAVSKAWLLLPCCYQAELHELDLCLQRKPCLKTYCFTLHQCLALHSSSIVLEGVQEVKLEKERLERERKLKQKQKAKDRVRSEKDKVAAEKEAAEREARERTEEQQRLQEQQSLAARLVSVL